MHLKIITVMISFIFFFSPLVDPITKASDQSNLPSWNTQWAFSQKIILPISTNNTLAQNQPIDIEITFENPCWTKNVNETSVRICCWHQQRWHELESQIYNLHFNEDCSITQCNLVFLVPPYADGNEQYYVYYNDNPTESPKYKDYVNVKDTHYIESPISEITAEAQYYRIEQEGICIYGVGQQGKLLDRSFSQIVVKQKKDAKDFDVFNADSIVSFAFSYYYGNKETDESASDQRFIQKKIFADGNLMVCFGIISESEKKDIRTTAFYKYYYTPGEEKRIDVHVKHEMLDEASVHGIENVDGRFGAMVSLVSRNPVVEKLNFGTIYPYLHFFSKQNRIEEYRINQNPTSSNREWVLSYLDDADLGTEAWLSYGEGIQGKTHAVIFEENKGFIQSGTDERDGIQVKVAVKQYFNFLGTEVDYASINFGRNSYEKGYSHDVYIPKNLVVEFNAEVFSSENGGYLSVQKETQIYQQLIQSRKGDVGSPFEPESKRYNLTLITHLGGTHFSFPFLVNKTQLKLPVMWIEIYKDGQLVTTGATNRSLFSRSYKTINSLEEGKYLIKVYRKRDPTTKILVGENTVIIKQDTKTHIFCTWQRTIQIEIHDQNDEPVPDVYLQLRTKEGEIYGTNTTDTLGVSIIHVAYNPRDAYTLQAWYKDLLIYEKTLNQSLKKTNIKLTMDLYDITVTVADKLGLPPGVNVFPTLSTIQSSSPLAIIPATNSPGKYLFSKIPTGRYLIKIEHGMFSDQKNIHLPTDGLEITLLFSAVYDVIIHYFDSTGSPLTGEDIDLKIIRDNTIVATSTQQSFALPPALYTIKAYRSGENIGVTTIELTNDQSIKLVTTIQSLIPYVLLILLGILVLLSILLVFLKKISFSMLCKLLTITCTVFALIQPWWMLTGTANNPQITRETRMLVNPPIMIEAITIDKTVIMNIAELPEIFIGALDAIYLILIGTSILIGCSLLCDLLKKKTYSLLFIITALILCILVTTIFSIAAEKICEISIGSLQGNGPVALTIQETTTMLSSQWGFSLGYYSILSAIILLLFSAVLGLKKYFYPLYRIVRKEKQIENKK